MVLYLVGFMASGKSTVGELVAKELKVPFVDLDKVIEERSRMTIPEIFAKEGEVGFRRRERSALLASPQKGIAATGGGCVIEPKNREFLKDYPVVYLQTTFLEIMERLNANPGSRPLLSQDLEELYKKREPLYLEVAQFIIDTDGKSQKEVADEVIEWYMSI